MADILKEKSEKVRRKAMAALGEYLFYGATQMDEDSNNVIIAFLSLISIERLGNPYKHSRFIEQDPES